MKTTPRFLSALMLLTGVAVVAPGTTVASGSNGKSGFLKVTKECSQMQGKPGDFCTIASSNIRELPARSKVFYTQAAGIPAGLLDSNVVLDAGNGNRALGRCHVDLSTFKGVCTYSDGTGHFAGFSARVDVSLAKDGVTWHWNGTYEFNGVGIALPIPKSKNGK